ncbi:hypothetical protein [Asticcacaulis sp.]|uniref:hypothetical protein n=1 Tax=Asticcacaulis sp. TaxID=1872648 RepID=UPI003F7B466B
MAPNRISRKARAPEISAVFQPNSFSSGGISTPGAPSAQAVVSMTRKVTPAITQP